MSTHPLDEATIAALLLNTRPWLSCDDCFRLLDTYAEAIVRDPTHRDVAMSTHLAACGACHEEAGGLIALLRDDLHGGRHRAGGPENP